MQPCNTPCNHSCCCATAWHRSVKQKTLTMPQNQVVSARVEVDNEVSQLRNMVLLQQQRVNELVEELEEERNASASATSEAMSMILRLQREKAEVLMDARNFKRFAEEQMGHDQEEIAVLEEALARREEVLNSLVFEIENYRFRLRSVGVDLMNEFDGALECEYPSVKCGAGEDYEGNVEDLGLEEEIDELERMRDVSGVLEKERSELRTGDKFRVTEDFEYPSLKCRVAVDDEAIVEDLHLQEEIDELEKVRDVSDVLKKKISQNGPELETAEDGEFDGFVDDGEGSGDEMSYRVYTVVAEDEVPKASVSERYEEEGIGEFGGDEGGSVDIEKLYKRLRVLEEDREAMRKAIITMGTEKARLALLEVMAEQLRKEAMPEKAAAKKKSWIETVSFLAFVKWPVSFVSWRKKVSRSKYTFGLSNANVGLLLLLDKSSEISNLKYPGN